MLPRIHGFDTGLFNEFRRLEREMDQLFGAGFWPGSMRSVASESYPPINVGVTTDQVDVYLFVAGLDPEKLDITIKENRLLIKGERNLERDDDAKHFRKERHDDAFQKLVNLPEDVDAEKVEARYENGVLHLVIQRRESSKPRQITVQ
ncbi:MAG: Hsp20/alpha crystallin family protein [Candidatus Thiodiazotropha sp. (ex Ctena orbiculata)]|nr:Hsp20/alpha crystallin family protein [Candidatus Thiodiazotropha taylori]MBT3034139.1 Hsp20/alpha crystallin family protein [Candidatus Thiodiazotropha taylori]MBV2136555.1 Hsp20/alpha crystallin family protein [Candidatus Thiodiazotropha taylori]PUB81571.1 MAG: heat-shock protein Hsp20 [gamma proteobacterium symbiont of Ctena orbiculata]